VTRRAPRPRALLRAVAAAACSAAVACGERSAPRPDAPEPAPRRGGTVVAAWNADFQAFNPLVNTDQNTNEVNAYLLFTPLVQIDSAYGVRPYLARTWTLDSAGVTFELRRDVRWHDGRPVTAHDVAFTFRRAKDPATASPLASAYLADVRDVEVVDPFVVRFRFAHPHAQPLEGFGWAPVPRHLLDTVPPERLRQAAFNRAPVGSGPFRFVEWQPQRHAVFERNPDFPEALGGPPRLDRIVFRVVEESTTRLTELLNGGLDVNLALWPGDALQAARVPGVRVLSYPSRNFYYIGWNTRRPWFARAAVRRALTMAIDRARIIETLAYGQADPAAGPIPPWHPFSDPSLRPLPYDPEAARAILAREGWADRDGDGVREDPAGRAFRFTLLANVENPVRADIAQVVQAQLREVGVDVQVRLFEWQTMLARHRARDFDAVVTSWVLDSFRVDPYALFHSAEADVPGSYNRSGLRSPAVDRWIDAGRRTPDPERAAEIWARFGRALQEEQPFTFLFWVRGLAGVRDRVKGVRMDARGQLATVADWWVAPEKDGSR
jgi:peptide/nickel transport system substrate-binding protein